jgi:hypothetical protein
VYVNAVVHRRGTPRRYGWLVSRGRSTLAVGVLAAIVIAGVVFAVLPRGTSSAAGDCGGQSSAARLSSPYAIELSVRGNDVVSPVDFDHRLWRAVDNRVARNGLVAPSATRIAGSIALLNREEAVFRSPGAFATFLTAKKAEGCPRADVSRAGRRQPPPGL